jgi:hypothetical protein
MKGEKREEHNKGGGGTVWQGSFVIPLVQVAPQTELCTNKQHDLHLCLLQF